jgi:ABC-type multidrug transport system fused ATPase/permease subunit
MFELIIRILKCTSKKNKTRLIFLQLCNLLVSLLNIISALLIAPFILILNGDNIVFENKFFNEVTKFLLSFNFENQLLFVGTFLVIFYSISIIFSLYLNFLNYKWIQNVSINFQISLYNFFINRSWIYHSNTSSNTIVSKIHSNIERLVQQLVLSFIDMLTSFTTAFFVLLTVILVDYRIAISLFAIIYFLYSLFYFYFKKKLKYNGEMMTKYYPLYYKSLFDGFGSIKDTILFDKKEFFLEDFKKNVKILRDQSISQNILYQIPRSVIELTFFLLLIVLIYFMINIYNYSFIEISSLMAFYCISAIKMIPSFQKFYKSISSINSNRSAFELIEKDLFDSIKNDSKILEDKFLKKINLSLKKKIVLDKITFHYPPEKINGLENISIEILSGEKIGIVGKTGSGKSTLVDIIMGLIKPDKGKILIDDIEITESVLKEWHSKIAHVPQRFFVYEGTIESNVAFGVQKENINKKRLQKSLQLAELHEFVDNTERSVGEHGKKLSGGQKQRLGIARAIYKNCEILVLDEATSALDSLTEKKIIKNIKDSDRIKTLIVISHRIETLNYCDTLFHIEDSNIKKITHEELLKIYK